MNSVCCRFNFVWIGLCALTFCLGPLAAPLSAGVILEYDFTTATSLPSVSGLPYVSSTGVAETDVFKLENQVLKVDTTGFGPDVYAGYQLDDSFDSTIDVVLEFRARTLSASGGLGMFIGFSDASAQGAVELRPTGWSVLAAGASGSITPGFHDFKLTKAGGSNAFTLDIDGSQVAAGTLSTVSSVPSYLYFGDGSPTGGNIRGEIEYLRYSNSNIASVVPEPSSCVTLGLAAIGLLGGVRQSRRRAEQR
ncbi:PEP-CTERM sorting domain-containing protein [Roseimaritima ulvae]|nr:PEP-CTERM sorting domain-containing protein [Roseimaritima ulvae]